MNFDGRLCFERIGYIRTSTDRATAMWSWVTKKQGLAALGVVLAGGLYQYGQSLVAAVFSALAPPSEVVGKVLKRPPAPLVVTGSIKPPEKRSLSFERCVEGRHADVKRHRASLDTARSNYAACAANYRKQWLFEPLDVYVKDHCREFSAFAAAHQALLMEAEARECQR